MSLLLNTEFCELSVGTAGSGLVSVIFDLVATLWMVEEGHACQSGCGYVGVWLVCSFKCWLVRRYINGISSSAISTSLTLNLYLKYSYLEVSIVEELNG